MMRNVLAFDFGASSGRAMIGTFDGTKIQLHELHRFDNDPVNINGTLYWDALRLFHEIKQGIIKANNVGDFHSIGIDTWGIDFGLISKEGALLENPVHYRDKRTVGMIEELCKIVDKKSLYSMTGNQFMEMNTIFQLYYLIKNRPQLLAQADKILLMPDLFNYFLTGSMNAECSSASTTQLLDPYTKEWNYKLIGQLGIAYNMFPPIVKSGTTIGYLSKEICEELGVYSKPVISIAAHDTASAVAAVPAEDDDFIFISCGTWSLFGTELNEPVISAKSHKYNLTNEVGYNNTTTFLKNIIGLWLIQETRRQFRRDRKDYSYADMERMAKESKPFQSFIDPDAPQFVPQGDIPTRIREYCHKTGQVVPDTDGQIIRCIYDSIAMKYKHTFRQIKDCTQKKYQTIHMVGGGTKDYFLCQLTANATNCNVVAGPVEATAFGNVVIQLLAQGAIKDIRSAREIVRNSFKLITFTPSDTKGWDAGYRKFQKYLVSD